MEEKKKKSVLGKGLGALISSINEEDKQEIVESVNAVQEIPLEWIEPNPYQPRVDFDQESLQELAESIKAQGIIQPITLRKLSDKEYQIISGERRFRACKIAGLTSVPAYIRSANDEQMIEMAIIENVQREDLNAIEIALGYKRLMEECQLTLEQVGEKIGKKRSTINNYIRLLKLPPEIQVAIRDNKISMGHARAIITIDNPVVQLSVFKQIIDKDLSVRQVEKLVQELSQSKIPKNKTASVPSPLALHLKDLEIKLSKKFSNKVSIIHREDGKGEVRIPYYSQEDLDRLLELLMD
ncbi:MAG: chromosome partitioning protein ParB [Bacteroidia bacterium]|nr:MAG: chromosome partitioning protein ParB [Bacteroidia bacterium]